MKFNPVESQEVCRNHCLLNTKWTHTTFKMYKKYCLMKQSPEDPLSLYPTHSWGLACVSFSKIRLASSTDKNSKMAESLFLYFFKLQIVLKSKSSFKRIHLYRKTFGPQVVNFSMQMIVILQVILMSDFSVLHLLKLAVNIVFAMKNAHT